MIKRRRMLALILVAVMALSLMACGGSTGASTSAGAGGTTETAAVAEDGETPLVVGYSPFNSKFSPFFSETAYDQDVQALTQLQRMQTEPYSMISLSEMTLYSRMESPSRSTTLSSLCMYSAIPLMTDPLHFSPSLSRVWKSTAPVWRHSLT